MDKMRIFIVYMDILSPSVNLSLIHISVISITLTRIMLQSENAMIVDDALQRIDSVLRLKPL